MGIASLHPCDGVCAARIATGWAARHWKLSHKALSAILIGGDMSLEELTLQVIEFVREHEAWAAPVVFALAFAESLAFLSFFVPAWAVLVGIGALMKTGGVAFWPVMVAGAVGAALGDWLSYWLGHHCKRAIVRMRPFSTHPTLLPPILTTRTS